MKSAGKKRFRGIYNWIQEENTDSTEKIPDLDHSRERIVPPNLKMCKIAPRSEKVTLQKLDFYLVESSVVKPRRECSDCASMEREREREFTWNRSGFAKEHRLNKFGLLLQKFGDLVFLCWKFSFKFIFTAHLLNK